MHDINNLTNSKSAKNEGYIEEDSINICVLNLYSSLLVNIDYYERPIDVNFKINQ
jgi:hypothetical protein